MATINELNDVLAHINVLAHDPNAWRHGLSYEDQRMITELQQSASNQYGTPGVVPDTLVGAVRDHNPTLFDSTGKLLFPAAPPPPTTPDAPPPVAPPAGPPPNPNSPTNTDPSLNNPPPPPANAPPPAGQDPPPANNGDTPQQGQGAEAIKKLESALKGQNSKVAESDRTLAEAVLNAYSNTVAGKQKLSSLQQSIEDAVTRQTALDTPMGAREFQKFLLGKQKEIIDVVTSADLDDKSKQSILTGLYGALDSSTSSDDAKDGKPDDQGGGTGQGGNSGGGAGGDAGTPVAAPAAPGDLGAGDPLASLLSDPSLSDPGLLGGSGNPLGGLGSQMPQMPMPQMPSMGGGGLGGLPGMLGGGSPGGSGSGLSDLLNPKDHKADDPASIRSLLDDPALGGGQHPGDQPGDKPPSLLDDPNNKDHKPDDPKANEQPTPGAPVPGPLVPPAPPGSGPTEVHLPNGQTVTAPNPQMAKVSEAIASGTPIPDAFRQNGMTMPPPGAAVPNPMDPSKVTMGAVAQFSDHQVYAYSRDWVNINGQIHPLSDVSGPGFLGWLPPPDVPTAPLPPATVATPPAVAAPAALPTLSDVRTPAANPSSNLLTPVHKP